MKMSVCSSDIVAKDARLTVGPDVLDENRPKLSKSCLKIAQNCALPTYCVIETLCQRNNVIILTKRRSKFVPNDGEFWRLFEKIAPKTKIISPK
jgi:hypothetical protein